MRRSPANLDARELAERSRLVPHRHAVQLTDGLWYLITERVELGGVVVGFRGELLNAGDVAGELEPSPSFELSHVLTFHEAWDVARWMQRAGDAARRARARERWRDDWQRPVGVGRVFEWLNAGDRRATEPAWKASRRARQIRRAT